MGASYSRDEMKAIIERALDTQRTRSDDVSHDELLAIGRELGVSGEALESAARSVRESRALDAARAEVRARERRGFIGHLIPFVLVNAAMVVTNLATGGAPWFVWSLLGWGIGLLMHARSVYAPDPAEFERRVQRHLERQRRRDERREQKRAIEAGVREIGAGVSEVLVSVADAVNAAAKQSRDERSRVRVAPEAGADEARDADEAEAQRDDARARRER